MNQSAIQTYHTLTKSLSSRYLREATLASPVLILMYTRLIVQNGSLFFFPVKPLSPKTQKRRTSKEITLSRSVRPTTTLCLGKNGSICVWSRSINKISSERPLKSTKITRLETLNRQGLDVHRAHWIKIKVRSEHSQLASLVEEKAGDMQKRVREWGRYMRDVRSGGKR